MQIHFLHGTETGNSEMVCEELESELGAGFDTRIDSLADFDSARLQPGILYVFVTSTYGAGDLPATAHGFMEQLEAEPELGHVRFAIFGLGDMVFADTFAQGSEQLMNALLSCKAQMVGKRGIHDASGPELPEDIAVPWMYEILASLEAAAA